VASTPTPTFYARKPLTEILTIVNAQYSSKLRKLIGTINTRMATLTPSLEGGTDTNEESSDNKLKTVVIRVLRRLMVTGSVLKSYLSPASYVTPAFFYGSING
jgi:hypothetical protein